MRNILPHLMLTLAGLFGYGLSYAQEAVPAAAPAAHQDSFWNSALMQPISLVMVSIIILLFFVILIMGKILQLSSAQYLQKMRKERAGKTSLSAILLLTILLPHTLCAQEAAEGVQRTVSQTIGGISESSFYLLFSIILIEVLTILIMLRLFRITMRLEKPTKEFRKRAKGKHWLERFNKTKSVAGVREEDVSTGHDYDGIKELDNPVPPWWKWGFYLSMVFAVVYIYRFHIVKSAPLQLEELAIATEEADKKVKAYLAASSDNVDENTVVLLTNAADISAGQVIFSEKCASCHAPDGGGIIGPNLTDDYWLHGCSIHDIFKTIKYGVPEKGMISWKDQLSPKQIAMVASYIHGLKGAKPASPKDRQGELCSDGGAKEAPPDADSTGSPVPDVALQNDK